MESNESDWKFIPYKTKPIQKEPVLYSKAVSNKHIKPNVAKAKHIFSEKQLLKLKSCLDDYLKLAVSSKSKQQIGTILDLYKDKLGTSMEVKLNMVDDGVNMFASPAEGFASRNYYDFENEKRRGKIQQFQRTRSSSWSNTYLKLISIRPPGIDSSHLDSFVISPREFTPVPVIEKQEKASRLREEIQNSKIQKNTQKQQEASKRLLEIKSQKDQLKTNIDEKMNKATMKRGEHLQKILEKAKLEELKRSEVLLNISSSIETKKADAEIKDRDTSTRLEEIQGERLSKVSDLQAMKDAALYRRELLEQERSLKLEEIKQKEQHALDEQLKKNKLKQVAKQKSLDKLLKIKEKKLELEDEKVFKINKKKSHSSMLEKLELGAKRKNDQLEKVREKAAIKNENAKQIAIKQKQKPEIQAQHPHSTTPTQIQERIEFPKLKTKMKKLKTELKSIQKPIEGTKIQDQNIRDLLLDINKQIFKSVSIGDIEYEQMKSNCRQLIDLMETKQKIIEIEIVNTNFHQRLISAVHMSGLDNYSFYALPVKVLAMVDVKGIDVLMFDFCVDFVSCKGDLILEGSSLEIVVDLLKIVNSTLESKDHTVVELLISYSTACALFNSIEYILGRICGDYNILDRSLSFIVQAAKFYNKVLTFGNQRHFKLNIQEKLIPSAHTNEILSKFIDSNVMGFVTLLTNVLMSNGASYKSAEQAVVSQDWEELTALVLDIISKMCQINHIIVQNLFKTPTELYHLMLFWLIRIDKTNSNSKILALIIKIVGLFSFENQVNIEMAQIGLPGKSLLQRLLNLDFEWFLEGEKAKLLMGTLSILATNERNRMVIEEDLSLEFLRIYSRSNKGVCVSFDDVS